MATVTHTPEAAQKSLTRDVQETLLGWIRQGRYPPGSQLPSVPELVRQLEVSRTVVREALQAVDEWVEKIVTTLQQTGQLDALFVAANTTKLASGGGITVGLALVLFGVFLTWRDGRQRLRRRLQELAVPLPHLPALLAKALPVPGAAVFLVSNGDFVPTALLRNLEHNRVRHELIIILHFVISTAPRVDPLTRARLETLWPGVMRLRAELAEAAETKSSKLSWPTSR